MSAFATVHNTCLFHRQAVRILNGNGKRAAIFAAAVLLSHAPLYSQSTSTSPWENAVGVLEASFTSTIARGLSLVAIVVGWPDVRIWRRSIEANARRHHFRRGHPARLRKLLLSRFFAPRWINLNPARLIPIIGGDQAGDGRQYSQSYPRPFHLQPPSVQDTCKAGALFRSRCGFTTISTS